MLLKLEIQSNDLVVKKMLVLSILLSHINKLTSTKKWIKLIWAD